MATSPGAVTDQGNCALHACAEMGRGRVGHAPPAPINTVLKDGGGGKKRKGRDSKERDIQFFSREKGEEKSNKNNRNETKRKKQGRTEEEREGERKKKN